MSPRDYAVLAVLGAFGAIALCALVLGSRSLLRVGRGTQLVSVLPIPRLTFSTEAKAALPSLRMWGGIFFTSIPLSIIVAIGIIAATTPSVELQELNTYFYHADGSVVLVGVSQGVRQCETDAAIYARAHNLFESAWRYECCAVGDSECGP